MALDSCRPPQATHENANTGSPLIVTQWIQMLQDHPDKSYVQFIIKGIQQGFRIGFNRCCSCYPAITNLPSQVPHVICEHLSKEVSLNRMHCYPLGSEPRGTQISPIGAIPKEKRINQVNGDLSLIYPSQLVQVLMMQSPKSSLPSNTLRWITYHLSFQRAKERF